MPPLALSDAQLTSSTGLAWPLAPLDRSPFLELVAQRLQEQTTVSDGTVHRIAVECQRRFFAPPPAPDRG